jgi:hypothetical protein
MACDSGRAEDTATQSKQTDAETGGDTTEEDQPSILGYVHDVKSKTLLLRTTDEICASLVIDREQSTEALSVASVRAGECAEVSRFHKLKLDDGFKGTLLLTNPVTNYKLDDAALCDLENLNQWFQLGTNPVSFNMKRDMTFGYGFSKTDSKLPSSPDRLDLNNVLVSDCASEAGILRDYFYEFTNETF